jgi:MipA family protein
MNIRTCILLAFATISVNNANANTLSIGAGGIYHLSPYTEYKNKTTAIPFVHYESDSFYVRDTSLGYIFAKDESNEISATVSYLPFEFKPEDSDSRALIKLDQRDTTALVGLAYSHREHWGTLKATFSGDVLDKSNGFISELSYLRPIPLGDFTLIPAAGVTWYSDKLTQYYFGVSNKEARRSGLSHYQPGSSWNPFVGLSVSYKITPQLTVLTSGRYSYLDNQIANSPMVDKNHEASVMTGVSWTF